MKKLLAPVLGAAAVAVAVAVQVLPAGSQSSGVYSAPQAAQGGKLFAANCASCHSPNLAGGFGPPLAGGPFIKKWSGQTADDLYGTMATLMPQTAPGSLKPADYLALVAFVLQKNGYPAGSAALEQAKLKSVVLKPQ